MLLVPLELQCVRANMHTLFHGKQTCILYFTETAICHYIFQSLGYYLQCVVVVVVVVFKWVRCGMRKDYCGVVNVLAFNIIGC